MATNRNAVYERLAGYGGNQVQARFFLLLGLFAAAAFGQFGTGEISGVVSDPSSAPIPAAAVNLRNEATGQSKAYTTDATGRYTALDLLAGKYTIEVSRTGFKSYVQTGVVLVTSGRVAVNVSLALGEVSEKVEITAQTAQVETLTATVGKVVEGRLFRDMPLNGRNLTSIMLMKPGVVSTGAANAFRPTSDARSYVIHGSRAEDAYLSTDGVAMTGGRNNLRGPSTISVDAIAEANILTSNYAAELPRAGGGQVQFVTKSGTKEFHGALFEYLRNNAFDARSFQRATKQKLRFNQFGFALGGPVLIPGKFNQSREKLFFFANTEWLRNRSEGLDTVVVPTPSERTGDFNGSRLFGCPRDALAGGAQFAGCRVPAARFSPNGMALLGLFPVPNAAEPAFNFRQTFLTGTDYRTSTFRVDGLWGAHRVFWRGSHSVENGFGNRATNFTAPPSRGQTINESTGITLSSTLSPTLLNSARFGASSQFIGSRFEASNGNIADFHRSKLGINYPYLFGNDKEAAEKIPTLIVGRLAQINGGPFPLRFGMPSFQYQDDITWVRGRHTLKFGGYYEYIGQNNLDQINTSTAPGSGNNQNGTIRFEASPGNAFSTGNQLADLITGRFDSYHEIGPKSYTLERQNTLEFYAQDSFKISPRLSLEFGLRYGNWPAYHSLWNNFAMFYPSFYDPAQAVQVNPVNGQVVTGTGFRYNGMVLPGSGFKESARGRVRFVGDRDAARLFRGLPDSISTADRHLFQPRFGLAWDPTGQGRTSVRIGGGAFNSRFYFNDATVLGGNPPLQDQAVVTTGSIDNPGGAAATPLFPLPVTMHDPHIRHATTYNFSMTVQHQLPAEFIVELGYIGKLSRHLLSTANLNQLPAGTLQANRGINPEALRPYRGYSSILHAGHRSSSNYNGFTASLERRFHRGLTLQLAYTMSRSIDDASDKRDVLMISSNRRADRGLSSFDRTNVFYISYVYEVPFFTSDSVKMLRPVFAGWQLAGLTVLQSGLPTSVFIAPDTAGVSGGGRQRANVIGNGVLPRSDRTFVRYFNTSAFAAPAAGTFGNGGRNILRRPGTNNSDVSISKNFRILEGKRIQLRGEFFNIWNHLSFNNIETTLGNAGFGAINGADPARVVQLAARFEF